jgi:hypothetical protein
VVVAVMPDSPRVVHKLGLLLERTRFGEASVADLIEAARPVSYRVSGPI